jgi:hypothetical protein
MNICNFEVFSQVKSLLEKVEKCQRVKKGLLRTKTSMLYFFASKVVKKGSEGAISPKWNKLTEVVYCSPIVLSTDVQTWSYLQGTSIPRLQSIYASLVSTAADFGSCLDSEKYI